MRFVYYSLACSNESNCAWQWVQSIRSLRRYNGRVPVYLFLYNEPTAPLLHEAHRWGVHVHHLGDYYGCLYRLSVHCGSLVHYPTFHKILSLPHAPTRGAAQVLYADCDTFFFDDVERLFDLYSSCDYYGREEPCSRRSPFGYDPAHVDEDALADIVRCEGLRPVAPFNTGVCLFNHGVWHDLERLQVTFVDLAWRLLVGRHVCPVELAHFEPPIAEAVQREATLFDRSRALAYPSRNPWIVDQFAFWLTLGFLPRRSQGFLRRDHCVQGGEPPGAEGRDCVIAHYFSSLQREFFASTPPIGH